MRIDTRLAEKTIVRRGFGEPPARRILIAISTLIVAALVFAIPSLWSGKPTNAQSASPAANAVRHGAASGSGAAHGAAPGQELSGFLNFDWDRKEEGPGFDPWLADGYRP